MSEGNEPSATFTQQQKPTERDVDLLNQIVTRAQQNAVDEADFRHALIAAYQSVFSENGLDVRQDHVCIWVLLKILDPNRYGGTLYERFEQIMRSEGIELRFEGESSVSSVQSSQQDGPHQTVEEAPRLGVDLNWDDWINDPPPIFDQHMRLAEQIDNKKLVQEVFGRMRPRGLAAMDAVADQLYDRNLKLRTMTHLQNLATDRRLDLDGADRFNSIKLKHFALAKLLDAARIQRIRAMDEARLKGLALYRMTLATCENHFKKKYDHKLRQKYWQKLATSFLQARQKREQLEAIHQKQQPDRDRTIAKPALLFLAETSRELQNMGAKADKQYDSLIAGKMLQRWRSEVQRVKQLETTADDVREYHLINACLSKASNTAQLQRNRRTVLGRWVLDRWRKWTKRQKLVKYESGYRLLRRKVKTNLARKYLLAMIEKTRVIAALENQADDRYWSKIRNIGHGAVTKIYTVSTRMHDSGQIADGFADQLAIKHAMDAITAKVEQVHQMEETADRFRHIQLGRSASNCVRQVSMRLFEIQQMGQKADAYRARKDRDIIRKDLSWLRAAAADSRGEEPLKLPPATPAQRRAEEMSKLASTTPSYTPATSVSFAARLRGESGALKGRTTERIVEEVDDEHDED